MARRERARRATTPPVAAHGHATPSRSTRDRDAGAADVTASSERRTRWQARLRIAVAAALIVATAFVYAPVREAGFVNYDDPEYVTDNANVTGGLRPSAIAWAVTHAYAANWHPVTWISHMLDCELFGLDPAGHHLTSVALHAVTSALLFAALVALTGATWPSAWVAALFALHPAHVESVAWIAERKDVLCALFWMTALIAYARWVQRPTWRRYAVLVVVDALALMAKPMAVTLPFALLLLDLWPLRRVALGRWTAASGRGADPAAMTVRQAVVEKLPLFALTVAMSVVTLVVQSRAGAIATLGAVPFGARVENAILSYARYLGMLAWPTGLAAFYPLALPVPLAKVELAAAVLLAITVAVVREASRRPWLLAGWLWYLVTLLPVIGLVREGEQAMADRFTYIPSVGVFVMVAWTVTDAVRGSTVWSRGAAAIGVAAVVACALVTRTQVGYWHDSETLFRHALAVTSDNYLAHTNLAAAIAAARGSRDEAFFHHQEAVRIRPDYAKAQANYGMALAQRGDHDAAIAHYQEALRLDPSLAMAQYDWGVVLAADGQLEEAEQHYREALRLDPRYAKAENNLGWTLAARGRMEEAIAAYREALRIDPRLAPAHNNLAVALENVGRTDEALAEYEEAVRLSPDDPKAHFNLAAMLAGRGRADAAIEEFRKAGRLAPRLVETHLALAQVLATAGRKAEAADAYRSALQLAPHNAEAEQGLAALGAAAPPGTP